MTLKELLSLFHKKLSVRIFLSSLVFIFFLSSIFYFIGKSILINNSKNNFLCTFLSCTTSLSSELTTQKNIILISNSIIQPIISKFISESKSKNLENSISRELMPILKDQNPDIFFIRLLPITGSSSDYIIFSKRNGTYLMDKGITKNKKLLKNSRWWQETIKKGEYLGVFFPAQTSIVYSKIIYYNGIPAAIIGSVTKKERVDSVFFKFNNYDSMNFQLSNIDFNTFYSSKEFNNTKFISDSSLLKSKSQLVLQIR